MRSMARDETGWAARWKVWLRGPEMIEVPLELSNRPHWELKGRPDSARFFRGLAAALPAATTLYLEGTGFARDVEQFLRSAGEPGDYLPKRHTLWPRPAQFRLRFEDSTLAALAALAARHAEPELLDHLFVYQGSNVLLEFPDAFLRDSPVLISAGVDEQRLRSFAAALGLELVLVEPDSSH